MPLYEYQCIECNRTFEVLQRVSEPDPAECSTCGGRLERQLSAPSIRFKGAGWYVTDYAKPAPNGSSNGTSEKKESTPATTADTSSKPAAAAAKD